MRAGCCASLNPSTPALCARGNSQKILLGLFPPRVKYEEWELHFSQIFGILSQNTAGRGTPNAEPVSHPVSRSDRDRYFRSLNRAVGKAVPRRPHPARIHRFLLHQPVPAHGAFAFGGGLQVPRFTAGVSSLRIPEVARPPQKGFPRLPGGDIPRF